MRNILLAIGLAATLGGASLAVQAQDAANGQQLFTTALVAGKQSCSSGACHGALPANPQNRIANGISAPRIKGALVGVTQMDFLQGKLSDAQLNDVAAYIAGKLGGTPTYLAVAPMPSPALSPASLAFASQALHVTSTAQAVTVSNATGAAAALVLGAISVTAGSDFAVSGGTCANGTSLAAGASCTITISFTPSLSGVRSATLTVAHNGSAGSSTVALSGSGVDNAPSLSLSPTALSFSQTVGTRSEPMRVTLTNSGTAAVKIDSLTLGGAQAAEFSLEAGSTCAAGATVAAGSNCWAEVRFTPTAAGTRSGSLVIKHEAGSSSVALNGQGTANAQPGLALDAVVLDLGAQGLNSTGAARTATVTNSGQAALAFSAIRVTGTNAADVVLGGTCAVATPVAAAASCTITAALKPSALGPRAATIEIASNAPTGTATLSLGGVGIAAPAPEVMLSQASIGFGTVTMGTSSIARSVTLSNSGSAALTLTSLLSSSSEFVLTHNCAASLAPGERCRLDVVYKPTSATAAETVVITSNAFSSPNSVVLTGMGSTATLPVLAWADGSSTLQFASTEVGKSTASKPLTLTNQGPGSVTVSALGTAGAQAENFSVGGGTCLGGVTLAANTSCTVVVNFVPDAAGPRSAVLLVASNGSNPPDIALSGSGVAASTGGGGGGTPNPGGGGTPNPGGGGTPNPGGGGTPNPGGGDTPTPATGTLAVSPSALDYRAIPVRTGGRSEPLTVRIANSSAAPATIAAVTTTGRFIVESGTAGDACPGVPWTLAAGKSCTVVVTFAPGSGGTATGKLKVMSASGQATEVALSAEAHTVGSNEGAGALDPTWVALMLLAIALLLRANRSSLSTSRPKDVS